MFIYTTLAVLAAITFIFSVINIIFIVVLIKRIERLEKAYSAIAVYEAMARQEELHKAQIEKMLEVFGQQIESLKGPSQQGMLNS